MSAARGEIWALVAVKRFDRAKTRLAPSLGPAARAALAAAMLEDVLAALDRSSALAGVLVVTSDPAATAIVRRAGAGALIDVLDCGVNSAVDQGLECLARRGARRAVVVPADVPLIAGSEIDEAAAALDGAGVVLAPAEHDGGTNLLGLSPIDAIVPAFGPDSLNRHVAAARAAGIEPRILRLAGAGLDIDTPADLERLATRGGATRSGALLREFAASAAPRLARPLPERIMQP